MAHIHTSSINFRSAVFFSFCADRQTDLQMNTKTKKTTCFAQHSWHTGNYTHSEHFLPQIIRHSVFSFYHIITHFCRMPVNSDDVNGALVIAVRHCAAKHRKHDSLVLLCAGSSQFGSWWTYFHAITTYRITASQHFNDTNAFNCSMQIFWKQHMNSIWTELPTATADIRKVHSWIKCDRLIYNNFWYNIRTMHISDVKL